MLTQIGVDHVRRLQRLHNSLASICNQLSKTGTVSAGSVPHHLNRTKPNAAASSTVLLVVKTAFGALCQITEWRDSFAFDVPSDMHRPDSVAGLGNVWCVFDDGVAEVLRPPLHAYLGKLTLSAEAAARRRFCVLHHLPKTPVYTFADVVDAHSCFTISTSAPYGRRVLRAERTAASPSPNREVYSAFSNSTDLAHITLAASVSIDPLDPVWLMEQVSSWSCFHVSNSSPLNLLPTSSHSTQYLDSTA